MTAFSPDCHVRVWCVRTGTLIRKLEVSRSNIHTCYACFSNHCCVFVQFHTGEVFVLEPHPLDSRILLTAGHDGLVVLWDMLAGIRLRTLQLEVSEYVFSQVFVCTTVCLCWLLLLGITTPTTFHVSSIVLVIRESTSECNIVIGSYSCCFYHIF